MDEAELVLDYIDVLIWPMAILGIAALVVFRFREQIAAVILRIQAVHGPGGSAIIAPLVEQKTVDVEQPPPEAVVEEPPSGGEAEQPLPNEVVKRLESGEVETQAAQLLRVKLADTQNALYYERVYRVLWGTQISLLQALNERPNGVTMAEVIPTYLEPHEKAVQQFNPSYKNDLTTYMTFLSSQGLVQFKEPNSYVITELGTGFLTYIARWGIPTAKWY